MKKFKKNEFQEIRIMKTTVHYIEGIDIRVWTKVNNKWFLQSKVSGSG